MLTSDVPTEKREDWFERKLREAADVMAEAVRNRPEVFEPKTRWAMDWYYPVLTGVLTGEAAKARLAETSSRMSLPRNRSPNRFTS